MTHAIDWFEIPCTDIDRAQAFYEALLQVTLHREAYAGPGMQMAVFPASGEDAVRGALQAGEHVAAPSMAGTVIYLHTDEALDTVLARLPALQGRLLVPKTVLPDGMGCFAHVIDSEGNRVGVHAAQ